MSEFSFSENDLRNAARAVRKSMLASLPEPSEIECEFSEGFLNKMDVLIALDKRRQRVRLIARRVAMIFLAILLGLSTWLAIDTEARATAMKWIREVIEDNIYYRFFGTSKETKLPNFVPAWLPDGFTLTESDNSTTHHMFFYEDTESNMILFDYCFLSDGLQVQYSGDDSERETVYIREVPADFYPADETSFSNNLIWIDEYEGIVFLLDSNLEKEVMLRIADSVTLRNMSN